MTPAQVRILRLSLGVTLAVAISYGVAWPLYSIVPLFTAVFLALPLPWIGWKVAFQIMRRLAAGLLCGLAISEFLLPFPLLCIPIYGLLFFYIYFNDATAPPMATLFMTIGVTMVPILGLQATMAAHFIAGYMFFNLSLGFVFMWLLHLLVPASLAKVPPGAAPPKRPPPPPVPSREERARLAMVSTLVASSAVILFFTFNLAQYSLAMIYICMMAGTPTTNASLMVMKGNSIACLIGGVAIVIAYNLLVATPTYGFLVALVFAFSLFFATKIMEGTPKSKAWNSGFTTFLVLLGSSTSGDADASSNFYLRIAQVLFAGLFSIVALLVAERITRPGRWRLVPALKKPRAV